MRWKGWPGKVTIEKYRSKMLDKRGSKYGSPIDSEKVRKLYI